MRATTLCALAAVSLVTLIGEASIQASHGAIADSHLVEPVVTAATVGGLLMLTVLITCCLGHARRTVTLPAVNPSDVEATVRAWATCHGVRVRQRRLAVGPARFAAVDGEVAARLRLWRLARLLLTTLAIVTLVAALRIGLPVLHGVPAVRAVRGAAGDLLRVAALLVGAMALAGRDLVRARYHIRLTAGGQRVRLRASPGDRAARARLDELAHELATPRPIDMMYRTGTRCPALTLRPPSAGWAPAPPPLHAAPERIRAYRTACVAWAERVESTIEIDDLLAPPRERALASARSSLSEKRLVRALATASLPVVTGLAVPSGSRHPDPIFCHYWPDAAVRDAAMLLLIDVECDGTGHSGRAARDARRDRILARRGWYTARLRLNDAEADWPRLVAQDVAALVRRHRAAWEMAYLERERAPRRVHG